MYINYFYMISVSRLPEFIYFFVLHSRGKCRDNLQIKSCVLKSTQRIYKQKNIKLCVVFCLSSYFGFKQLILNKHVTCSCSSVCNMLAAAALLSDSTGVSAAEEEEDRKLNSSARRQEGDYSV